MMRALLAFWPKYDAATTMVNKMIAVSAAASTMPPLGRRLEEITGKAKVLLLSDQPLGGLRFQDIMFRPRCHRKLPGGLQRCNRIPGF